MTPEQQKIILLGRARRRRAEAEGTSAPQGTQRPVNEFEPAPAPDIAGNNRLIPQPLQQPTQAPQTPGIGARASEGILRNDVEMRSKMREQDAFEAQVPVNVGEERAAAVLNGLTLAQFPRAAGALAGIGSGVAYPLTGGKIGNGQGYGEFVSNETEEARKKARLQVTRGREKRPLESMGLEVVPGFFTGKTAFDMLTQGKKVGGFVRGVGSGTISGASYGLADRSNDVGNIEQRAVGDTGAVSNREVGGRDVALSTGIGAVAGGVLGGAAGKGIEVIGNRASGRVQGNLLGPGKINVGNLLDMELAGQPLSPKALNRVVSIIRKDGNLASENVKGLFEAVQQRLGSMDVGQSERLTLGQALSEALERDYPQAARNIETALLNSRLSTRNNDSSPAIIGRVADDLRGSQSDFLSGSTKANLGDKSALSLSDELDAARSDLGTQYEAIFSPGASVAPAGAVDDVNRAIQYWRNDTGLTKAAEMIARGEGYDAGIPFSDALDHYIKTDPRRTAHWMQSAAAQLVRKEKAKPKAEQDDILIRNYTQIRDNLLKPLEKATPGYKDVRSKFGTVEEIDAAADAGNTFFLKARNEGDLDRYIRDDLGKLSPEARAAALASIRDKIGSFLRGGPEDAPARITQISSTGALDALEKLGPDGAKLADDIRFVRRENQHLGKFVPTGESTTAKNIRAMGIGESLGGSGITSAMTPKAEGGGDIAALLRFGANMAGKGINALAKPRVRTLEDTTRFLMARKGNIPSKPKGADFSPRFAAPGSLSQGADTANPVPSSAKQPVSGAGLSAIRSDAGNALAGGVVGGAMPADNNQDRARNIMIGAGGAGLAGRVGPRAPRGAKGAGSKGRPELPMDEPARMARAKADGFDTDTVLYHGTTKEISQFDSAANGRGGRAHPTSELGHFFAETPEQTIPFAGGREKTVLEDVWMDYPYVNEPRMVKAFARRTDFADGGNIIPAFVRLKNPKKISASEWAKMVEDGSIGDQASQTAKMRGLRKKLESEGHDGIVIAAQPLYGEEMAAKQYVIFDPKNIRSKFAKFDPDESNSPILSAGISGKPPKIKSDIPLGTPAKGKAKLPKSLNEMMAEPVPMQGIAKATGHSSTIGKVNKSAAENMMREGKTAAEVHKKTGLVPLEINGKRILLSVEGGADSADEVIAGFYAARALPRNQQEKWVQELVDEFDPLVLDKPLQRLGNSRLAVDKDGKLSALPKGPVRGAGFVGGKGAPQSQRSLGGRGLTPGTSNEKGAPLSLSSDPHSQADSLVNALKEAGIETSVSKSVNRYDQKSAYIDIPGTGHRVRISDHPANPDFRSKEVNLWNPTREDARGIATVVKKLKQFEAFRKTTEYQKIASDWKASKPAGPSIYVDEEGLWLSRLPKNLQSEWSSLRGKQNAVARSAFRKEHGFDREVLAAEKRAMGESIKKWETNNPSAFSFDLKTGEVKLSPLVKLPSPKGPVRGAGLLAVGGAGAVAAKERENSASKALPPRNKQGQFQKQPDQLRIGAGR
jgi:hypothetical protein